MNPLTICLVMGADVGYILRAMNELIGKICETLNKSGLEPKEPKKLNFTLLHGDASARRYVRITGLESESLVAMILAPEKARFSEEAMKGPAPLELPFLNIQRVLKRQCVRVPVIHFVDEKAGVILLEDLGDRTLEKEIRGTNRKSLLGLYRLAVELLVSVQASMEKVSGQDCIAFSRAFEFDLLRWELDHFLEYLVAMDRQKTFSPVEQKVVQKAFDRLASSIASWPRIFVHRDFQSRNIMIKQDEMILIDFQDALLGPAVYDLVALLRDSYVKLDSEMIDTLIDHYLGCCQQQGLSRPDRKTFQDQFDRQTVQRKLKDAGRFVFIDRVKKNPNFLPFIPSSLAYVSEALNRLDDLAECREIVAKAVPELAS